VPHVIYFICFGLEGPKLLLLQNLGGGFAVFFFLGAKIATLEKLEG